MIKEVFSVDTEFWGTNMDKTIACALLNSPETVVCVYDCLAHGKSVQLCCVYYYSLPPSH